VEYKQTRPCCLLLNYDATCIEKKEANFLEQRTPVAQKVKKGKAIPVTGHEGP
jgi:hypothetical protein